MPTTLYEQFFAVGSVKSLLTGKEISSPEHPPAKDDKQQKQSDTSRLSK